MINRLIQELRALVVKTRVVVNNANNLLLFAHNDLHTIEYLVEKPISNPNSSFGDKHNFEYLFILVLNHVIIGLFVKSGLQNFHKLNQKVSHFLILKDVFIVIGVLFCCHRHEICSVFV